MKIISHRGNLRGPNPATENTQQSILVAIANGFDVEIDVWYLKDAFYLGHDFPIHMIERSFLESHSDKLWIHCKHLDSLLQLKNTCNCFYHDKDIYTITTHGYIWGNINSPSTPETIQVLPERSGTFTVSCFGICTDYPVHYASLV